MHTRDVVLEKTVIIISVYDRLKHIKQCLESLEAAVGCNNYHVIVGSDSSATEEDSDKIDNLREYLLNKENNNGFKKLSVIYHKKNVGQGSNMKACDLLAKSYGYDSFIFMEDDVVVGTYFLNFMQEGLKRFASDEHVIAINGYLDPNIKTNNLNPFLFNEFSAYGFASWYKKWDYFEKRRISNNYAAEVLSNTNLFKEHAKFSLNAKSYPFMAENFYEAADIATCLMMDIEGLWVLVPPVSLTANKGLDGSGLRSGVNVALQAVNPYPDKVVFPKTSDIRSFKYDDIKNVTGIKNRTANWYSFIIYKYIPFGYAILKRLRKIKKIF
ncbi:glycosyltransferase family 2 protein [Psychrobacter sp. ANT_H56B]|uniref:glycosyltransferase family 2 protein n=1 Tax=Psychrobacter sp. ANT_H56B TaxID=2597353 RepID=UPI00165EAED0|nr:glycosyltransferase [Psychrobacter sp. ANT_H56B]